MADMFYGVAVGGMHAKDVTNQASTTSAAVELRVSDTAYANKLLVIQALRAIVEFMETKEGNPIS